MLNFAINIRQIVQDLREIDDIATKIASDQTSCEAQQLLKQGANALYSQLVREACYNDLSAIPTHTKVVTLINKVAEALGYPELNPGDNLELAAMTVADEALSTVLESTPNEKLAEARDFGREYFATLLQRILV